MRGLRNNSIAGPSPLNANPSVELPYNATANPVASMSKQRNSEVTVKMEQITPMSGSATSTAAIDNNVKEEAPTGRKQAGQGTSDFVKKLYNMLEEEAFKTIVVWGPKGDSFIVKVRPL